MPDRCRTTGQTSCRYFGTRKLSKVGRTLPLSYEGKGKFYRFHGMARWSYRLTRRGCKCPPLELAEQGPPCPSKMRSVSGLRQPRTGRALSDRTNASFAAGSQANKFSPARPLFVGPNSAPNPRPTPSIENLAVPGVRIHPLHHPVPQFSHVSENRSKSARVGAICDRAWTQRTSPAAPIGRIQQDLSALDFPGPWRFARTSHSLIETDLRVLLTGGKPDGP